MDVAAGGSMARHCSGLSGVALAAGSVMGRLATCAGSLTRCCLCCRRSLGKACSATASQFQRTPCTAAEAEQQVQGMEGCSTRASLLARIAMKACHCTGDSKQEIRHPQRARQVIELSVSHTWNGVRLATQCA